MKKKYDPGKFSSAYCETLSLSDEPMVAQLTRRLGWDDFSPTSWGKWLECFFLSPWAYDGMIRIIRAGKPAMDAVHRELSAMSLFQKSHPNAYHARRMAGSMIRWALEPAFAVSGQRRLASDGVMSTSAKYEEASSVLALLIDLVPGAPGKWHSISMSQETIEQIAGATGVPWNATALEEVDELRGSHLKVEEISTGHVRIAPTFEGPLQNILVDS